MTMKTDNNLDDVLALCEQIKHAREEAEHAQQRVDQLRDKLFAMVGAQPPKQPKERLVDLATGDTVTTVDDVALARKALYPNRRLTLAQIMKSTSLAETQARRTVKFLEASGQVAFEERRAKGQRGRGTKHWYLTGT